MYDRKKKARMTVEQGDTMNEKCFRTLEYDKIIAMLREKTVSQVGAEYAERLRPADSLMSVRTLLMQTEEADALIRRTGRSPVAAFPDLRGLLGRIHAALYLSAGELLKLRELLKASREAKDALEDGEADGLLASMASGLTAHRSVEEEIGRCILSEDEIADAASPELTRIRRQVRVTNEHIREKLNSMIRSSSMAKYLQEPIITVRSGRYTLPVKAEHRGEVPGLIHDQSGSGATVFVEPAAVVELGNVLKTLHAEEEAEIERILAGLTAHVAPYETELAGSIVVLGTLDVIFAKAILGREMRGHIPKFNDAGKLRILRGRHPLLPSDTVVPVDIWLGDTFTTLIITGPNTGGKTVTLKTVGLLTLMGMSGMLVPADDGTELSVFSEIFADIGDEQSIEQSLSTFSSHMKNTVSILERADGRTLVLLDELGAGTDPLEGAALAQAILETMHLRGARTVATTHYSEIKAFALTHEGMQNASMEFDVDRLCPTYRLFIGIPGKSNAFEISRRLGLDDAIIGRAGEYLEKKDVAFENVLTEAERARREAETLLQEARNDRYEAQRIRTELAGAKEKLENERAALRAKAREEARGTVQETRREMEQLIAGLRNVRNIDTRTLENAIRRARDDMRAAEAKLIDEAVRRSDEGEALADVTVGQTVHVVSVDRDATVLKRPDAKGEVLVQAGIIKLNVPMSDLRTVQKPKPKQRTQSSVQLSEDRAASMTLDIRGKMVDEAVIEIDRFLDNAAFTGLTELTIIHGKGTGALRTGVQNYLRRDARVKAYRMGAYGEGDAGVTVVTLKS